MNKAKWKKVEAKFRAWSFNFYWDRVYMTTQDAHKRFQQALLASMQPIRDKDMVIAWSKGLTRKLTIDAATCSEITKDYKCCEPKLLDNFYEYRRIEAGQGDRDTNKAARQARIPRMIARAAVGLPLFGDDDEH